MLSVMGPEQIAAALGDSGDGDQVLEQLDAAAGPEVARAIRDGFEGGDEQGNFRRLTALVKLEGEGCLDVMRAVLEDTVEVGGIYSNLRNGALELMRDHFPGHPALAASLWRAMEIDEYLHITWLYPVVAAYDKPRALALLEAQVEMGVPQAIKLLAQDPDARPMLLAVVDKALAGKDPGRFIELLGEVASEPDLAARIRPLADTVPAAAEIAMADGDLDRIRGVADRLWSPEARWRSAAVKALRRLPAVEAFDRAAPLFTAADRVKEVGRGRVEAIAWTLPTLAQPLDPRWFRFLIGRLAEEHDLHVRGSLVEALATFGADAAEAIVTAARDDKDKHVLAALPDALAALGPDGGVLELVRTAAGKSTGKIKKALEAGLEMFDA